MYATECDVWAAATGAARPFPDCPDISGISDRCVVCMCPVWAFPGLGGSGRDSDCMLCLSVCVCLPDLR